MIGWQGSNDREDTALSTLAETVLPLIRTGQDLHRYAAANAHDARMHEVVGLV